MALIPFKWVGGKGKLAKAIGSHFPEKFGNYYELFAGASAVFFNNREKIKYSSHLSDINFHVITTLTAIRDNVEELISCLSDITKDGISEEVYYEIRKDDRNGFVGYTGVDYAARFLVINRTGYNGLWRENKKGFCNTPYGHYDKPKIVFADDLRKCSEALKNDCQLSVDCFEKSVRCSFVQEIQQSRDLPPLYYLDPPYVNYEGNGFTGYSSGGFGHKENLDLLNVCKNIHSTGGYFIQSNLFSEKIIEMYGEWCKIHPIDSHHNVGAQKKTNGKVKEVIIKNF